jgi:hypothetical protein
LKKLEISGVSKPEFAHVRPQKHLLASHREIPEPDSLKHLLRKAAERTLEATWKRIGALLDCFSPNECQAYLANAGYGSA